ncbi:MAG: GNAT family N-acetyltransferase [Bacteroidetes bacterium]|nr:GNAT family N-acetyltransferase [Bacteroidota bacterium]
MLQPVRYQKGEYMISTDPALLDIQRIHQYLSTESYWAKGIPFEKVKRSIEHSLNFGVYHQNDFAGFARIISDYTTVAYLGDVFILPGHRGKGLSKWLMEIIMQHPDVQGLRRWILLTGDAHELYKKYGWVSIKDPSRWMELHNKDVYVQH